MSSTDPKALLVPPLTDGDLGLAPLPVPPKALRPDEILRLGALTLQAERSAALEDLLEEQKAVYAEASRENLIQALLDRDRQLANMGRQIADGRVASRMLREFVRGLLNMADYQSVRAVGDATKTGQIEKVLEALGAEPADLRQLKLQGSTLGRLDDPEGWAEDLASGKIKR